MVLWLGTIGVSAQSAEIAYRYVRVRVVDEAGLPMPGVTVCLVGPGRGAPNNPEDAIREPGGWKFVSDWSGRLEARFGCFDGNDRYKLEDVFKPEDLLGPAWGRFYFVAEADGLRGVSACVLHEKRGDHLFDDDEPNEWTRRGVVKTSAQRVNLILRLRRGLRVSGKVIDTAGSSVADCALDLQHDLHAESHTGYGGEMFQQSTRSDDRGCFTFDNVYPNTFYPRCASLNEGSLPVWVRTRVHGRWIDGPVFGVTPRRGEKEMHLTFEVSRTMPYLYLGRVMDPAGHSVAGAQVTLGISRNARVETYADNHTFLHASTDQDGRYQCPAATPFLSSIWVKCPGFADYEKNFGDEWKGPFRRPGVWNVTLRPQRRGH